MDESEVTVDDGKNGKVTVKATDGNGSAYSKANTVQSKNNVLLKLKQSTSASEPNYIAANGVEMTRDIGSKTFLHPLADYCGKRDYHYAIRLYRYGGRHRGDGMDELCFR